MKNVLIIEASPRKGFSTKTADQIVEKLIGKVDTEVVTLRDLNILPCTGCAACLAAGSTYCPNNKDDARKVLEKMMLADGLIIVVPNYSLHVTGLLKTLFDRLAYVFHRPRLFGKTVLPVVVQGVYGGGKVAAYINEVLGFWGMKTVKGAVVTGGIYPNKEQSEAIRKKNQIIIDKAVNRFFLELDNGRLRKPSFFKLMIFRMTRSSMKFFPEALAPDKKYYEEKGWTTSDYYYPTRLNPIKKLVGSAADRMIKNMADKA